MNNQNTEENPYAPPKSAADFRQPEKGTKKQRIARIRLGTYSASFLSGMTLFLSGFFTSYEPFSLLALAWFFVFLFFWLLISIIPCAIFACCVEYIGHSLPTKIVVALIIWGAIFSFLSFVFKFNFGIEDHIVYIIGAVPTLIAVFIMNAHKKRCDIQSLQSQSI